MTTPTLDFSALALALASLKKSRDEFQKNPANEFVRDAVIQRFEYTYELSHKMLKRFLATTEFSGQEITAMSFAEIIRIANAKGLLRRDLAQWNEFRLMRNITSHTYDSAKAADIVAIVPDFIGEAEFLLEKLLAEFPSKSVDVQ